VSRQFSLAKSAAVALGAIALLSLAACAEPGKTVTDSTGSSATYRNVDYHFAVTYDPRVFNAAADLDRNEVPAGSPPQLDWSAWPVAMGSSKPDPASLANSVGVSAVDFVAQGMSRGDFTHERAMVRRDALRNGGTFDATSLGGAKGYRAEWADESSGYRFVVYRLTSGDFTYTVAVVCRLSDWAKLQGPLLATAESFQVLQGQS
jgi:hypothetical protein